MRRCRGRPRSATTSRMASRSASEETVTSSEPPRSVAATASPRAARAAVNAGAAAGPTSTVTAPVCLSSVVVGASVTSRPASSMTTWSHTRATSSRRWVARTTAMPKVARRATRASISSRPDGSRPAVGSSRRTSLGSATMAWASLVRWRMPVENPPTGRNRASSSPTRSSTSDARWRAARTGSPPARRRWRPRPPPSGRGGGSRARACSRCGCARRWGRRPRGCRNTRWCPRRAGSTRAGAGTAWSCPPRWRPPARPDRRAGRGRRCPGR